MDAVFGDGVLAPVDPRRRFVRRVVPVDAAAVEQAREVLRLKRLAELLKAFADWQRRWRPSIGFRTGPAPNPTPEDRECAIVEECIDQLDLIHQAAILRACGVAAVFRFPRANAQFEDVLPVAQRRLMAKLEARGIDIG